MGLDTREVTQDMYGPTIRCNRDSLCELLSPPLHVGLDLRSHLLQLIVSPKTSPLTLLHNPYVQLNASGKFFQDIRSETSTYPKSME